ncbi:hypothetical protein GCM10007907_35780 [Chitinimonas prasina]|uniref:Phasin family protein n=1 Tax=Chitinimonas prasina TaxID=1434937 RepID=A0ABQ5YK16_9NEIS|nr:hypothetical protein [Chitinimonas prasina]GLR14788.1 hypothetical protein GCM10007907_35780 [Chitinimonas prasina]
MAPTIKLTDKHAYQIADTFAQASARILDFRIAHSAALSDEEATELEKAEDRLDQAVVLFRGYGIQLRGAQAEEAASELQSAIHTARDTIATIDSVKQVISTGTALVDLTVAVLDRDAKGALAASRRISAAIKGDASDAA